jgi:acetyl-CoA acyltransferase
MNEAVIVSAVRTPAGKAPSGSFRGTRPDDLAATAIREALRRAPGLEPSDVDDVILGCAMPEGEQGMNVARIASLRAGIPVSASAVTVNRFCSSGLQAIAYAAERIISGGASAIVAGGTESMSLVPMGGNKIAPNPTLVDTYPDVYLSTGLVAENHARVSSISREEQDAFALRSHQRAIAAIDAGRLPKRSFRSPPGWSTRTAGSVLPRTAETIVSIDEGPRRDTSAEALAKLDRRFTLKGNRHRRQFVADRATVGRGGVVVTSSAFARASAGLTPLGRFVTFAEPLVSNRSSSASARCPAIRKALKLAGLTLGSDRSRGAERSVRRAGFSSCLKELPIDQDKLNVNGGAIALGHPLGMHGRQADDDAAL